MSRTMVIAAMLVASAALLTGCEKSSDPKTQDVTYAADTAATVPMVAAPASAPATIQPPAATPATSSTSIPLGDIGVVGGGAGAGAGTVDATAGAPGLSRPRPVVPRPGRPHAGLPTPPVAGAIDRPPPVMASRPVLAPGAVRLPGGVAAALSLNGPERLGRRETGQVSLVLDRAVTEAVLGASAVVLTGVDTLDTDTIATTTKMRARLESATLNPVALSPEVQRMFDEGPTRWDWTVRADSAGEHTATVTVVALLNDGSEQQVQVYRHNVVVAVSWWEPIWDWIFANLQWVIVTLILPFLWFAYRWWRARKLGLPPPE